MNFAATLRAGLLAAAAFFAGTAFAAPLQYDEAVSGNLGDSLALLQLDNGDNTVTGTLTLGSLAQELDTWAYQVQAGQVLTGAWIGFSTSQTSSTKPFSTATVDLYGCTGLDGCTASVIQTWDLLATAPLDLTLFAFPQGEGSYTISPDSAFVGPRGEVGNLLTTAYTLHLLVAEAGTRAVSEPGTAVLAAFGLLALLAGRRRRG